MARQLFGTDGVRGRAGHFLTADLALALARTAVARLEAERPQVLIIRDTRESGEMLESAIAAGAAAAGGDALLAGVLPTPAAPLLVRRHGLDLAAVISASHNPYEDNGIKLFAADGFKLHDDTEHAIEAELGTAPSPPAHIGRVRSFDGAHEDYLQALEKRFSGLSLAGLRVLLDCAHGATFEVAPEIFRRLGADVDVIADQPDGMNINQGCGSTHLDGVIERVADGGYDVAFAFDGDGDRVLAVDRRGAVVDGDELIALAALHLRYGARLPGNGVAVTVMTNYGFHQAMADAGIEVAVTSVGDRYVLDELRRRGWALGGEQSGHIIFSDYLFTGDGLCTAVNVLRTVLLTGRTLADLGSDLTTYPQVLLNVRVREKADLKSVPAIAAAIERVESRTEGHGRLLVRYSGTEPLLRVMLEGKDQNEIRAWAQEIVDVVKEHLG